MEKKFLELIAETLEKDENEIQFTDKFREYDGWDSLAFLSLIAMIDEEYDVTIDGNDFEKLITLKDLLIDIKKRKNRI